MPPKLSIFDFDGTLFLSPLDPLWWPEQRWWSNPKSLLPPILPARPDASWWDAAVVAAAKQAPLKVLLSARVGYPELTSRITELVEQQGLHFQQVKLKPNGPYQKSAEWKAAEFKRLVKSTGAEEVDLYDDDYRNIEAIDAAAYAYGVTLNVIPGSGRAKYAACTEEEYYAMTRLGSAAKMVTAAPVYVFHGTATGTNDWLLKRILKEGLNPNPKKRIFTAPPPTTEDDYSAQHKREIATYGGIYLAYDPSKASSYILDARKALGGDGLLVIAKVETRSPSVAGDEDRFGAPTKPEALLGYYVHSATGQFSYFDALTALKDDTFDWTLPARYLLTKHWELLRFPTKPQQVDALVSTLGAMVRLNAIYWLTKLDKRGEMTHSIRYDFADFLAKEGLQPAEVLAKYRQAHDVFLRKMKPLVNPPSGKESEWLKEYHTFRNLEFIGYRGANRIVALLRIENSLLYVRNPRYYHTVSVVYKTEEADAQIQKALEVYKRREGENMLWLDQDGTVLYDKPNEASDQKAASTLRTASPVYVFHGTASGENDWLLKRVLKEGLNPNPKKRVFTEPDQDADEYDTRYKREIATYGGVYFAYSANNVAKFMGGAIDKIGGDRVLVIARIETRSPAAAVDEDVFGQASVHSSLFAGYIRSEKNAILNSWLALEYLLDPSFDWNAAAKWVLADIQKSYGLVLSKQQLANLTPELADLLRLHTRYFVSTEASGDSYSNWDWNNKFKEEPKDPKSLLVLYRSAHDKLLRRFKALVNKPSNYRGSFHSFRFLEPVTYSGSNRIVAVVRVKTVESDFSPYYRLAQIMYRTADALTPLKEAYESLRNLWGSQKWTDRDGTVLFDNPNKRNTDVLYDVPEAAPKAVAAGRRPPTSALSVVKAATLLRNVSALLRKAKAEPDLEAIVERGEALVEKLQHEVGKGCSSGKELAEALSYGDLKRNVQETSSYSAALKRLHQLVQQYQAFLHQLSALRPDLVTAERNVMKKQGSSRQVPRQFVAPAKAVAAAFGLSTAGVGTVGFSYEDKRWVVSYAGTRVVSPLRTAEVYNIYTAIKRQDLDTALQLTEQQIETLPEGEFYDLTETVVTELETLGEKVKDITKVWERLRAGRLLRLASQYQGKILQIKTAVVQLTETSPSKPYKEILDALVAARPELAKLAEEITAAKLAEKAPGQRLDKFLTRTEPSTWKKKPHETIAALPELKIDARRWEQLLTHHLTVLDQILASLTSLHVAAVKAARMAKFVGAEAPDPAKLQQVISLLQSVDFGQTPDKGLPVLEQARKLVLDSNVQPTDIELAIRTWVEDPEKAKGFIHGPSGRGSNKGALSDLAAAMKKLTQK